MSYENVALQAIKRIARILHEWEENNMDAREALELLEPDIKIIIPFVEIFQEKTDKLKKRRESV